MAQNIFNIGEQEEKILGIVKAQHGLKNKNQAMELILKIYGESFLEHLNHILADWDSGDIIDIKFTPGTSEQLETAYIIFHPRRR